MARMKLTRRQFPFTPAFLPSPLLAPFGEFDDLNATSQHLFDEVFAFLGENPVYGALIDMRGDDSWRNAVRGRRRSQIAALFGLAAPPMAPGRAERLAVIVPI